MKKAFVYVIMLIVAADTLSLDQLNKLPLLLEHFSQHRKLDDHITFYRFISMHYLGKDLNDNDTEQDMKLPFKKMADQYNTLIYFRLKENPVSVPATPQILDYGSFKEQDPHAPSRQSLFKPPCA